MIDNNIIQFTDDVSKRIFRTKDGYLVKGFLNADKMLIDTDDPKLNRIHIQLGDKISDKNFGYMVDIMKRSKIPHEVTDLDLVNSTCNLECEYCSVKSRPKHKLYKLPSVEQVKSVFDNFNIRSCNFLGGESLTEWESVKELCKYIETTCVGKISIFTNGKLLDKEKLDFFATINKNIEYYIPITSDYSSKNHYTVQEFYDRKGDFEAYPNQMFSINLLIGDTEFDTDDLLTKVAEIVKPKNFDLLINSVLDDMPDERLMKQLNNFQNMIRSDCLDLIELDYDRPEFIGFTCSGFNFSACSEGFSTCSMATLDSVLEPHVTIEEVKETVEYQIKSRCKDCTAFDSEELCTEMIRNMNCIKLNEFNCYYCPDLGRCSYMRCSYRIAMHHQNVQGSNLSIGCLIRLMSRVIIEYLNEKGKNWKNRDDIWYLNQRI
jgi:organic radical activating enzyme